MKRVLKWAGYALAGVVLLLLVAIGGAFAVSEAMIRWPVKKPEVRMVASTDAGAVERGRRVATLNGCQNCHGKNLEGHLFHDEMPLLRVWGPNLSRLTPTQTDADLDRAIRHGVAADGRRLWIMPSNAFTHLTDQETADLIAYMRTFRPTGEPNPGLQVGPVGRVGVLLGKVKSEPETLAVQGRTLKIADLGPTHAQGRDLARTCLECHGPALEGGKVLRAPDLDIVASYDPEDFTRLMRTGIAAGGRKVGMMTFVARERFSGMTDQEIAALQGYLKARAQRRIAQADAASENVMQR